MRLADTHVHIWDFNRAEYSWLEGHPSILNRNYRIEELQADRVVAGVKRGILVEAD